MTARHVLAFVSGVIFAVGLAIGGMLEPARVVGFLDFFGTWDPTLAFVMGGALAVAVPLHHFVVQKRATPFFDTQFHTPTNRDIEPRLLVGSAVFGMGWALAGFCPGPGLTTLATGTVDAFSFVAAMAAGMYAWSALEAQLKKRVRAPEAGGAS